MSSEQDRAPERFELKRLRLSVTSAQTLYAWYAIVFVGMAIFGAFLPGAGWMRIWIVGFPAALAAVAVFSFRNVSKQPRFATLLFAVCFTVLGLAAAIQGLFPIDVDSWNRGSMFELGFGVAVLLWAWSAVPSRADAEYIEEHREAWDAYARGESPRALAAKQRAARKAESSAEEA